MITSPIHHIPRGQMCRAYVLPGGVFNSSNSATSAACNISWRCMVTTFMLQTQFGEDRCTQFRVILVTDPQTNEHTNLRTYKHTNRQGRLQYTAPQLSKQCKIPSIEHLFRNWYIVARFYRTSVCLMSVLCLNESTSFF